MIASFLDFTLYPVSDREWPAKRVQGRGEKGVLLLYQNEKTDTSDLNAFLDKVLSAAKIKREQDAFSVQVTAGERISLSKQPCLKSSSYVLIFGLEPQKLGLGFQLPAYRPVSFQGRKYLWSDTLSAIAEERRKGGKEMSGQLWQALQALFIH